MHPINQIKKAYRDNEICSDNIDVVIWDYGKYMLCINRANAARLLESLYCATNELADYGVDIEYNDFREQLIADIVRG